MLLKRGGNLTKNYFATDRSVGKCAQLEFSCTHFRGHFKAHLILAQKTLKDLGSKNKVHLRRFKMSTKGEDRLEIQGSIRVFCPKLA